MRKALDDFYAFVEQPIALWTRPVLVLLIVFLALAVTRPLWYIAMYAPQYTGGLHIDIYSYTLKGGHEGRDLVEFNILNHYIGMEKLDRVAFAELDWLPFGIGALALLTLRVAILGNVRSLLDLSAIVGYFTTFSLARFLYKMYAYGHNLAPDAPLKVEPFMPVVWGSKTLGNFTTFAHPASGTYLMGAFALGVFLVTLGHLIHGRHKANKANKATKVASAGPPSPALAE